MSYPLADEEGKSLLVPSEIIKASEVTYSRNFKKKNCCWLKTRMAPIPSEQLQFIVKPERVFYPI